MPAEDEASGEKLAAEVVVGGKYRLVRPAGFGGMGVVWVARNLATDAEVAVKVLTAQDAGSSEAATRFRREAHAAARLSHRGIVRIFDLVELGGRQKGALVLVMELLRGETLADALDRATKFEVDYALDVAEALLSALSHAHAAGIVHRDLKPGNVFLSTDPDGHVTPKLLDFGISKIETAEAPRITTDGALLGTPSYMSPEQARGAMDTDHRSDLFSVGILLYEMVSGSNPFGGGTYHAVVAAILERDAPPIPELPPAMWDVLAKALRKKASARFQTADAFSEAIRAVREGRPRVYSAPPPRPSLATVSIVPRAPRRGRLAVVIGFFAALAVGAAGLLASRWPQTASAPAMDRPPPQTAAPSPPPVPDPQAASDPALGSVAADVASGTGALGVRSPPRASPRSTSAPDAASVPAATPPAPPLPAPARPPTTLVRDPGF